jgi:hypothetical protein
MVESSLPAEELGEKCLAVARNKEACYEERVEACKNAIIAFERVPELSSDPKKLAPAFDGIATAYRILSILTSPKEEKEFSKEFLTEKKLYNIQQELKFYKLGLHFGKQMEGDWYQQKLSIIYQIFRRLNNLLLNSHFPLFYQVELYE